jgi:hypothetical protein
MESLTPKPGIREQHRPIPVMKLVGSLNEICGISLWRPLMIGHHFSISPHRNLRLQQAAVCYFVVMPRSFAAFVRTARCSSIDLANSAGPPGLGTWAVVIRRSLMSGSASITVLMSAAMRSRRSFGIVGGPNSPTSPSIVSAGYPASATVGMSGIAEARAVLVTARTLILPAWICERAMA